ncbi:MAG: hypothetical protein IPK10_02610 [Bacteroidetes bacterium]|nr:hypothetical protein [Bacteroidota bacterium]
MRKLLIYSMIMVVAMISIFLANYALVHPITANIVSGFALLISLSHLLIVLFHPKGWVQKEKNFLGMWVGPLLYSLNKIISPFSILMLLFAQPILLRWMNTGEKTESIQTDFSVKWKYASSELMWISITYFMLDLCREYTVWHEFQFQTLPAILLVAVSINWMIFSRKRV